MATADKGSDEAVAKFEIACGVEGFDHRGSSCTWAGLGLVKDEPERAMKLLEHVRRFAAARRLQAAVCRGVSLTRLRLTEMGAC